MCDTQSEVTFTKLITVREITAGDPGPGFGEFRPPPRIVVGTAPFNDRELKAWFSLAAIVLDAPTCTNAVLAFVGSEKNLAKLCDANATVELHIVWEPAESGAPFTTTARFSP